MADPVRQVSQILLLIPLHVKDAEYDSLLIVGAANQTFEAHHEMKDASTQRLRVTFEQLHVPPVLLQSIDLPLNVGPAEQLELCF